MGTKPSGAIARSPSRRQPGGKKSHAVLSLGWGMPGVSGDENVSAPPRFGALAKEPGLVPSRWLEGFAAPRSGKVLVDIRFFLVGRQDERRIFSARFPTPVQTGSGSTGTSQRFWDRAPSVHAVYPSGRREQAPGRAAEPAAPVG